MQRSVKYTLYFAISLLLITGLLYAIPLYWDRWFFIELDWPFSGHWLMVWHGAGSFIMLFLFGYLHRAHSLIHWRQGRHLRSGLSMAGTLLILAITGYLLYYVGDEELRLITSDIHCLFGIAIVITLIFHWLVAKQQRAAKRNALNTQYCRPQPS